MQNMVLEKAEFFGIDLQEARPLWDRYLEAARQQKRIPDAGDGLEIQKLRSKVLNLAKENPRQAIELSKRVSEMVDLRQSVQRQKAAANQAVSEARIAARIATRKVLQREVERLGRRMGKIAEANEQLCLVTGALLPVEIVHLYERARVVTALLGDAALYAPHNAKGWEPVLGVFAFVRGDLVPGVKARCCVRG